MPLVVLFALAVAGCASSAPGPDDGIVCELAEVSPEPEASGRAPLLIGGLEQLRISLAGPPGTTRRRGAIAAEVLVGRRLEVDSVRIEANTSVVPDSVVHAVLMRTQWQPSETRYTMAQQRCRLTFRLDRTDRAVDR